MDPADLNLILNQLPPPQRCNARKRIRIAETFGWREIDVWIVFVGRAHEDDLVGVNPKGDFRFLPTLEELGGK